VYDVQQLAGHSKASITLDVYGELWEDGHERLAERMDAALQHEQEPTEAAVVAIRQS